MNPLYLSVGLFVVAFALAMLFKRLAVGDSATFIALLAIPLLVYGVATGKIQEMTGPGGWGAKFREVANQTVSPVAAVGLTDVIQRLQIIEKAGMGALTELRTDLPKPPIALAFQLGQHGYNTDAAIKYVQVLLIADNEMTALILDADRHFVAMTEGTTLLSLLQSELGPRLISALNNSDVTFLRSLPGLHTNSVRASDTNATALELMRAQNARAIVVLDLNDRPIGVIKRDDIVARLLEKLAAPDTP